MAHFMGAGRFPYQDGDSLEAIARAGREGWRFIDRNMHATSDLVGVGVHWGVPRQNGLTHLWTGPGWGEGQIVKDPTPDLVIANRPWSNVQRLTDATGKLRLRTAADGFRAGVAADVVVVHEPKGAPTLDRPEFWQRFGEEADAAGHPRVMMTLTDIGSPLRRLTAAHGADTWTAILPRGDKPTPTEWGTRWRPVVDAVWGTQWGDLIP